MTKASLSADKPPACLTGTKRKTTTSSKKTPPTKSPLKKGTLKELEAARSKRCNKKKAKIYADVDVEQEIKDGVWKDHLASNKIPPKKRLSLTPTKIISAEYQTIEALEQHGPIVSDNANIYIQLDDFQ